VRCNRNSHIVDRRLRHSAFWLLASAFVFSSFSGCSRPDYFPLKPGRTWTLLGRTYATDGSDTTEIAERTYTFAVRDWRNDSSFGRVAVVELTGEPFYGSTWYLQKRRDGVWLLLPAATGGEIEAPTDWIRILAPPLKPERAWVGNRAWDVAFELRAIEDVATPARAFRRCVRIRVRVSGEGEFIDYWLAPNAGLVRWQRRFGPDHFETAELVSAEP
jgi:hypothetical protein